MTNVTAADLAFATRFVAVYLFTRVKGSRPMTYQYLTIGMMEKAKENGGLVDQTEFKTAQQYSFDSLIFDETSTRIIDDFFFMCLVWNKHWRSCLSNHICSLSVSEGRTCCLSLTTTSLDFQQMLSFADPCYVFLLSFQ